MAKKKKYVNKFGVGLLLGAATGYLVSYLAAPKSGDALQDELSDKANKLKEKTDDVVSKIKNKTSDLTSHSDTEAGVAGSPNMSEEFVQSMPPEETVPSELIVEQSNENLLESSIQKGTPIKE